MSRVTTRTPASCVVFLAAMTVAMTAQAAEAGQSGLAELHPGLWETQIIKYIVDGRVVSSQSTADGAPGGPSTAHVPPEQRARVEAMMKERRTATMRICVSPEVAARGKPLVDRDGRCEPTRVKGEAGHVTFELNCTANGVTATGKGESTMTRDLVRTTLDTTNRGAGGDTHVIHTESEMRFIGPDCGGLQPVPPPRDRAAAHD